MGQGIEHLPPQGHPYNNSREQVRFVEQADPLGGGRAICQERGEPAFQHERQDGDRRVGHFHESGHEGDRVLEFEEGRCTQEEDEYEGRAQGRWIHGVQSGGQYPGDQEDRIGEESQGRQAEEWVLRGK